jgi:hypothetical protein
VPETLPAAWLPAEVLASAALLGAPIGAVSASSGLFPRAASACLAVKARFISAAVTLINRDQKGFATAEIHAASKHLRLKATDLTSIQSALREMLAMLSCTKQG